MQRLRQADVSGLVNHGLDCLKHLEPSWRSLTPHSRRLPITDRSLTDQGTGDAHSVHNPHGRKPSNHTLAAGSTGAARPSFENSYNTNRPQEARPRGLE